MSEVVTDAIVRLQIEFVQPNRQFVQPTDFAVELFGLGMQFCTRIIQ